MSDSQTLAAVPVRPPLQAYLVLAMGVLAVSLAAIFIRLAQNEGIPSLFIAAGRMVIASLVLTPIALGRHSAELRRLSRADLGFAAVAGLFLAVHFATWILSLEYTSVLISVVLVNTNPLWVALLEIVLLRASLRRWVIVGLIVAVTGSFLVAIPGASQPLETGANPLLGAFLAVMGALTVAVYFVIGRKLRAKLSLITYIWLVYGCSAIILLAVVIISGIPILGYSPMGYFWLFAMALVPQLIGHSSFNYVLKYFPATYVGISVQLEPVFSAIFALFLFTEIPSGQQVLGSATILAGVVLASLGQSGTPEPSES